MESFEVTAVDVAELLEKHPTLRRGGFDDPTYPDPHDLLTDFSVHQINYSILFLSSFSMIKTPSIGSSNLKHRIEDEGLRVGNPRVSGVNEGIAIAAGLLLEIPSKQDARHSRSMDFALSTKEYKWVAARKFGFVGREREPENWKRFIEGQERFV